MALLSDIEPFGWHMSDRRYTLYKVIPNTLHLFVAVGYKAKKDLPTTFLCLKGP